jgi:hypothetical protein
MRQNRRPIILYALSAVTALALGAELAVIIDEAHEGGTRVGSVPTVPAWAEYVRNTPSHRCLDLHPGDGAVIHAGRDRVVRLYRDHDLIAECRPCTPASHCRADHDGLHLEWTFDRAGQYGVYRWMTFRALAPPSQRSFLADLAAEGEHAAYVEAGEIPVRP